MSEGGMEDSSTQEDGCAVTVRLDELLDVFYPASDSQLGQGSDSLARFTQADSVPEPFGQLLDHDEHMTVTVESFHGESVDVRVLRYVQEDEWYVREILLVTQQTKKIVQYGIVRLNTSAFAPEVWERIASRQVPLGRVLIEHDVLRRVNLCKLWKVEIADQLSRLIELPIGETIYGRTALIHCDGIPAIELLEIVTP